MDQILSVCSGIGGLDLGLHAGLWAVGRSPRTVCMVEREAFCCAVLGKAMQEGRLDDCPIWCGDLRDLPVEQLPRIDWITGGYPCQPFSQAGKRLGEDDPRHLWPVIREQVRTLRPRGVFFENVAGHLTLGLDRVLRDLAGCGFRCAFGLFTAAEVGAPHRRERVFILGLADAGRDDETARGKRAGSPEGGRSRDGQGGSGCDAWTGHRTTAGQVAGVADGNGRGLEELGERDSQSNEDRAPRRDDARRCDSDLADAEGIDQRTGPGKSEDREEPRVRGELADANRGRGREDREPDEQGSGRPLESSGDQIVADTDGPGQQRRRRLRECPFERISRPGCSQRPDEPPRTVERGLGRGSHGLSDRVDRLRALGNAVVWQQAERAFVTLWKELTC